MVIGEPGDLDRFIEECDRNGYLDRPGAQQLMLTLHEALTKYGADPEDHGSYRAALAPVAFLINYPIHQWEQIIHDLSLAAMRAIRDLKQRGDG